MGFERLSLIKKVAQNKNKEISLKSVNFLFLFCRKEKQVASVVSFSISLFKERIKFKELLVFLFLFFKREIIFCLSFSKRD
jgi:hypothetical protein